MEFIMNDVLKRMSVTLPFVMPAYVVVTKKPQTPNSDTKLPRGNGKTPNGDA